MIKNYNYPIIISIQLLSNINIIVINIKFAKSFFTLVKKKKKNWTKLYPRLALMSQSHPILKKGKLNFN